MLLRSLLLGSFVFGVVACSAEASGPGPEGEDPASATSAIVACPPLHTPVCGSNGVTYWNACYASANGATVAWQGACPGEAAACGAPFASPVCATGLSCCDGECATSTQCMAIQCADMGCQWGAGKCTCRHLPY
jgi:hypothetical protein